MQRCHRCTFKEHVDIQTLSWIKSDKKDLVSQNAEAACFLHVWRGRLKTKWRLETGVKMWNTDLKKARRAANTDCWERRLKKPFIFIIGNFCAITGLFFDDNLIQCKYKKHRLMSDCSLQHVFCTMTTKWYLNVNNFLSCDNINHPSVQFVNCEVSRGQTMN